MKTPEKITFTNKLEVHLNDSTHYGDGNHYFNCPFCGEQHCVNGSDHLTYLKCTCKSVILIIFDSMV